ncbi:MAG: helix-turn-helix transcriptional regulator [Candidatus Latescibacteria bacterium]|jgi:DNA-binding Xre family transcriptional regulator|nr:helix-turn-helix transcriptional regulator [Candidatus Latescibacterota bacterium]
MNPLKIKVILQALGVSKKDLSRETGLSVFYLSRMFNDKVVRPTRNTRKRLAAGVRRLISDENVL